MSIMRAVEVSRPGGPLELVERPIPEPSAGHVRIKVDACGICHSDALRNCGARPGDLVAILGIGGLGHMVVQYAAKMGFRTAAIARGKDKESLAKELGATF